MGKYFFNRKIKLILTIGLCVFLIVLVFSNTIVKSSNKKESANKNDEFPAIEFIGSAQQNASLTAWDIWTDIPGVVLNFTLSKSKTVDFRAFGSALLNSHAGFRFIVDDVAYGSVQYGDLLISPSSGWVPWYIERLVNLSSGDHCVKIQTICYVGAIVIQGEDYDIARLFVQAW